MVLTKYLKNTLVRRDEDILYHENGYLGGSKKPGFWRFEI